MYHRPRPEGPGLALYPPGCQRVNDTGNPSKAAGSRQKGIDRSSHCLDGIRSIYRRHLDECVRGMHSYLCCQVCKQLALLSMREAACVIVSSAQCGCIVGNLSSAQVVCIVSVLSSTQSDYIVGIVSSVQVVYIVIYVCSCSHLSAYDFAPMSYFL